MLGSVSCQVHQYVANGGLHPCGQSFSRIAATLEVYVVHTRVWGGREGGREGGEEGRGGEEGGKEGREGRADLERESVCVCVCVCVCMCE